MAILRPPVNLIFLSMLTSLTSLDLNRLEDRTERPQRGWMVDRRMLLVRHRLVVPHKAGKRALLEHGRQPGRQISHLAAAGEIQGYLGRRPSPQPLTGAAKQLLMVPPE